MINTIFLAACLVYDMIICLKLTSLRRLINENQKAETQK